MSPITIILVEDNTQLRQLIKDYLQREPHFTILADVPDGTSAVQAIQCLTPDIVILDIGLPDMNGLDLIPFIRQHSPKTCIIILSLHNETVYKQEALKKGASYFIDKQDIAAELVQTIHTLF